MEQLNCETVTVARAMQLSSGVIAPAGKTQSSMETKNVLP